MLPREPFTVRLPPDLIAAVRTRARDGGSGGAAALVEQALRLFLATSQADHERAALLSAVEEALVLRLDKRLGRTVEAMRDLIAKGSYDQCLTLHILGEVLEALFKNDQRTLEQIAKRARKEAADDLRRKAVIPEDLESEEMVGLRQRVVQLEQQLEASRKEAEAAGQASRGAQATSQYWQQMHRWEAKRVEWAKNKLAEQPRGPFATRKTLEQLLDDYPQAVPKPTPR